jgi:hypothetical protein
MNVRKINVDSIWNRDTESEAIPDLCEILPTLENFHHKYPNDVVTCNMESARNILSNPALIDNSNRFWSQTNHYPINCISNRKVVKEYMCSSDRITQNTSRIKKLLKSKHMLVMLTYMHSDVTHITLFEIRVSENTTFIHS